MTKPLEDTWISPKIEIRQTLTKGKGMFAVEKIYEGLECVVWGGIYANGKEAERAKNNGKMVMQWDSDLFSVENKGEDIGYFINHSCDPNVWMQDAYTLIAKRDIGIGEELTADYAFWEADEDFISEWECDCGASLCRKRVTGRDWRMPELQERYKNHFSPLIYKRIQKFF